MELEQQVKKIYTQNFKAMNIEELRKKLDVAEEHISDLINIMYNLEKIGKIYRDEYDNYIRVQDDFYLRHGIICISNKGKYYITLSNDNRIIIEKKYLNGAIAGDTVFIKMINTTSKHKKNFYGEVVRVVKKEEHIPCQKYLSKGILEIDDNNQNYYVKIDEKKIIVPSNSVNGAYPGDIVTVEIVHQNKYCLANVISILERKLKSHVFEYVNVGGILKWIPIGTSPFNVEMEQNSEKFIEGDRILATILKDTNNGVLKIEFENKISHKKELNSMIEAIACDHGFRVDFPNKCKLEAKSIDQKINQTEYDNRTDLRNLITVTIDGEDAKDLDDAISLEVLENDKYRLYVHIADVFHYVKPGTELFNEALKRGTSVYPTSCVIPMLPYEISNGICSLNENEDKLAVTCMLDIDGNGNVFDISIFKSIINSNCKMTYEKVNKLLDNNEGIYESYTGLLKNMAKLAGILEKRKIERGHIPFFSSELKIIVDDKNELVDFYDYQRGTSQLIIENFMLLANESIGSYAYWLGLPFVYRNHESPNIDKIFSLNRQLCNMEQHFQKIKNSISNPKIFQKILISLCDGKTIDEKKCISSLLLHYIPRAYYSNVCIGHYGLSLEQYATFTSPIRRFADLMNHMFLDTVIGISNTINIDKYKSELNEICVHISNQQIEAEKVENEVNNYYLKKYIDNYLNCELDARIIFMTENEIYIKSQNKLSGVIEMKKKFDYDNISHSVKIYDKTYKVGDLISVKIEKVNNLNNEIVFEPVFIKDELSNSGKILIKERKIKNDKYKRK